MRPGMVKATVGSMYVTQDGSRMASLRAGHELAVVAVPRHISEGSRITVEKVGGKWSYVAPVGA